MTEEDARRWIAQKFGDDRADIVAQFLTMVVDESLRQNLVSAASVKSVWTRHALDSAQLIDMAQDCPGRWMDIGSGAGFPGMVVGILRDAPMLLVEPRKRRAQFLQTCLERLGLDDRLSVANRRVEQLHEPARIISARAVASLSDLLDAAVHCATPETIWVLPKGRQATEEVALAERSWHGVFHVEQSITDPMSSVVVASGVTRR